MTLLTHAEYEESLHSPITKYTCQKNWRTGFWSVQYQQQQRKGIFNPLNTIHIHSAAHAAIRLCRFLQFIRGMSSYDKTTSTSTGSTIFSSPFRPFVIG